MLDEVRAPGGGQARTFPLVQNQPSESRHDSLLTDSPPSQWPSRAISHRFAELGPLLHEGGWTGSLPSQDKRPCVPYAKAFAEAPPGRVEITEWAAEHKDAGVGLVTALQCFTSPVTPVDCDVDDPIVAACVEQILDSALGTTPLHRIGRYPRTLRLHPGTLPIDQIRGARGTVEIVHHAMLYGIHPGTGQPYSWRDTEPLDVDPREPFARPVDRARWAEAREEIQRVLGPPKRRRPGWREGTTSGVVEIIPADLGARGVRALAYLSRCEAAVSGAGGRAALWAAALVTRGFDLDEETALCVLGIWNRHSIRLDGSPYRWSEQSLRGAVRTALAGPPPGRSGPPLGYLLGRSVWVGADLVVENLDDQIAQWECVAMAKVAGTRTVPQDSRGIIAIGEIARMHHTLAPLLPTERVAAMAKVGSGGTPVRMLKRLATLGVVEREPGSGYHAGRFQLVLSSAEVRQDGEKSVSSSPRPPLLPPARSTSKNPQNTSALSREERRGAKNRATLARKSTTDLFRQAFDGSRGLGPAAGVVFAAVLKLGSATVAEITAETDLNRRRVERAVARLAKDGLLADGGAPGRAGRGGRPWFVPQDVRARPTATLRAKEKEYGLAGATERQTDRSLQRSIQYGQLLDSVADRTLDALRSGSPATEEDLAARTHCPKKLVSPALERVRAHARSVERNPDGAWQLVERSEPAA